MAESKKRDPKDQAPPAAAADDRGGDDLMSQIGGLLERNKEQLIRALPRYIDPERFARIILTTIRYGSDSLQRCTVESVMGAVMESAADGLELDGVEAALVPYWNKGLGTFEAQYQAMYQGLLKVARRSPKIASINCGEVFEGDEFKVRLGTKREILHEPSWGDRSPAKLTHAYVVFDLVGGGQEFEVMTKAELDGIKERSKSYQRKDGPWLTDEIMMDRKTVLRRGLKYAPTDDHMREVAARDEARELGLRELHMEAPPPSPTVPKSKTALEEAKGLYQEVVSWMRKTGESDPRGAAGKLLKAAVPRESVVDWTFDDIATGREKFEAFVRVPSDQREAFFASLRRPSNPQPTAKPAAPAPQPAAAPAAKPADPDEPPIPDGPPPGGQVAAFEDDAAGPGSAPAQPPGPPAPKALPPATTTAPKTPAAQLRQVVSALRTYCGELGIKAPPDQDAVVVRYFVELGCERPEEAPATLLSKILRASDTEDVFKVVAKVWLDEKGSGR